MPPNQDLPGAEMPPAVVNYPSKGVPRHRLRRKEPNHRFAPVELCRIERLRLAFDTSQQNVAANRSALPARLDLRFAAENRQTEVERRLPSGPTRSMIGCQSGGTSK